MSDPIDLRGYSRRRFVRAATMAIALGVAGCTEPSGEGTPPNTEEPPEGPVADQNGDENQTPGRGPADGPGEENASEWPDGENGTADDENESGAEDGGAGAGNVDGWDTSDGQELV